MTASTTEIDETLPADPGRPVGKRIGIAIALIVVLIGGTFAGVHYWRYASSHVSTDDAALSSDVVQIAPQVSGAIKQVLVQDNQIVKAGDPLVILDDATYRAAVAQAQANLDAAIAQAKGAGVSVALAEETGNAQLMQAKGLVDQTESGITGAQADVARTDASVTNARALAQASDANIKTAQATLAAAQANRQRAQEAVGGAQAQVETARATVRAAQAAVEAAVTSTEKAVQDAHRYDDLLAKGAVSAQAAEHASAAVRTAKAQEEATRQQVEAAQAQVNARLADVNAARQQVEASDATVAQANAQLAAAQEQKNAAQASIAQAEAQRNSTVQSVVQAKAKREQAQGQLSQAHTAPHQVAASRSAQDIALAKIEQAKAALDAARIQLQYTRILAPVSGQISKKSAEMGALVQPGTPLMALVPAHKFWVVANYKETQLGRMRQGQPADIRVDALPGRHFRGHLDSVAAATGATFALLPADNATGNFTKVIQRIPVKIVIDPGQSGSDKLRAGMSVTASITIR